MAEETQLKKNEYAIGDGAKITFQDVLPDFTVDSSGILTISLRYKIESKFQINQGDHLVNIEVGDCGVFTINDASITDTPGFAPGNFTMNALSSQIVLRGSTGKLITNGKKGREGS